MTIKREELKQIAAASGKHDGGGHH